MKLVLRVIKLVVISILIMLFIYPFFHEIGHLIAGLVSGSKNISWGIFPVARTRLMLDSEDEFKIMFISLSGGIAPLIILLIPSFNIYSLYYIKFVISLMSAITSIMSILYVLIGNINGESVFDDAFTVVKLFPKLCTQVTIILIVQFITALGYIVFSRPLERTVVYLTKKPAD